MKMGKNLAGNRGKEQIYYISLEGKFKYNTRLKLFVFFFSKPIYVNCEV